MARPARTTHVRPALSLRRPVRASLIVLALVAVTVAVVENHRAAGVVGDASTAEAVLGTMEARFAVSHTWVEERTSGDESVKVQQKVFGNLSGAASLCRVLRDGGESRFGPVRVIDDSEVRGRTQSLCRDMESFRRRTEERLAGGAGPGSPQDDDYDAAFEAILREVERLRIRLERLGDDGRVRDETTQTAMIVILVGLIGAAGYIIREREQQLTRVAEDRDAVLQSAGDGILAFDRDGEIHFVNAAAAGTLGWSAPELIGRHVRSVLPTGDQSPDGDGLPDWMRATAATIGDDRELRRRGGGAFPISYTLSPAAGHDDRGTVVLTFQDIEPRRRLEAIRDAELSELRTIKAALVPPPTAARRGLDVATCHVAALEGVAGDFHLVVDGPGERTAIFVGDVAGKGLDAARRAAYVRAVLATLAPHESSPRRLLEMANRSLVDAAGVSEFFVTAACLVIDPVSGTVTWASAGHPPPILLDSGEPLPRRPSLPLGLSRAFESEEQRLAMAPGEGVLLYTDGLSEARPIGDGDPDLLGSERISRAVRENAGSAPEDLVTALREVAEEHSGGQLADDLCLVILRMETLSASASEAGLPSRREADAATGRPHT